MYFLRIDLSKTVRHKKKELVREYNCIYFSVLSIALKIHKSQLHKNSWARHECRQESVQLATFPKVSKSILTLGERKTNMTRCLGGIILLRISLNYCIVPYTMVKFNLLSDLRSNCCLFNI